MLNATNCLLDVMEEGAETMKRTYYDLNSEEGR